jgi:CRP/FNR family transcriptional regulator
MKPISETDSEFVCDIQAPCFKYLSGDEVQLIRNSKTQVLFRKGENLTKQGAFASYVLFIMEGLTKQHVEGDATRNYNLKIIRPGEFVGLSAVFTKNTFNYSAIALTDTRVFLVEKDAIAKVVQQNGMFAYNIIRRYCEQNANLFDTVRQLVYKQMNGRMADTLLYINGIAEEQNTDVFSLLSRRDIADFAGISTESTVKILKNFEKDGILRLDEKSIVLLNKELLGEISRRG